MEQDQINKIIGRIAEHEQRIIALEKTSRNSVSSRKGKSGKGQENGFQTPVDFSGNARAFFKRHGSGLSGPKKFVLVLSYMTKGDIKKEETFDAISNEWRKAEGPLGGKMQKMYATRAKEQDWIDSPRKAVYVLRPKWSDVLS